MTIKTEGSDKLTVDTKASCGCSCKEQIENLSKRINDLELELLDIPDDNQLTKLEARVDSHENLIDDVDNRLTDAEDTIDESENKISYIEDDVANLENDNEVFKNDISIEMANLEKLVGILDVDVVKLNKQLQ